MSEHGGRTSRAQNSAASAARISEMIAALGAIGGDAGGGVSRPGFTPLEREAHSLFGDWLSDIGLTVREDSVGNTIAELPGELRGAIGVGSHLDSVPHGGRYDGIAGVVAAVEVARILSERPTQLRHPLRIVAFAAEEGARFGQACIGSKAAAGRWTPMSFDSMRDADGISASQALREIGKDPAAVASCRWQEDDWAAFLELHIEQALVLETAGCPIGIVDMVSGSTRVEFCITGQAQHTGGTPMSLRKDALVAAAVVVQSAERLANDPHFRGTRATVGRLSVFPNSITTIPGEVTFTVDVRDVDSDRQRIAARDIARSAREVCELRGLTCTARVIGDASPTILPVWLREITMAACQDLDVAYRVMPSGASHDAQFVNDIVPAGMIFVPSRAGLSHVPEEWSSSTDIARGANVLVAAIDRLDVFLAELSAPSVAPSLEQPPDARNPSSRRVPPFVTS